MRKLVNLSLDNKLKLMLSRMSIFLIFLLRGSMKEILFNFGDKKRLEPKWMKKRVQNMQCLRAPEFLTRRNGEFAQAIAQNRLVFLS